MNTARTGKLTWPAEPRRLENMPGMANIDVDEETETRDCESHLRLSASAVGGSTVYMSSRFFKIGGKVRVR